MNKIGKFMGRGERMNPSGPMRYVAISEKSNFGLTSRMTAGQAQSRLVKQKSDQRQTGVAPSRTQSNQSNHFLPNLGLALHLTGQSRVKVSQDWAKIAP